MTKRLLPFLFLCAALLSAEDWVIQNQTLTISTRTTHTGEIYVLSGGVLDIAAPFTQKGHVYVFGGGLLKIHDCPFRLESTYNGQYYLLALETGRIEITGISYSAEGWQAGIIATDDGVISIRDSDFFLDPAGVTQPAMYGRGSITLEDSTGDFEVILLDQGRFEARRIPPTPEDPARTRLWVWPTFGEGDTATLTYPAPGVQDFAFPGPGDSTAFSYLLENVNIPFWPLLVKPGSSVTLKDNPVDRHLIVGHLLYQDIVLSLRNNTDYEDFTLPVSDRSFNVVNSRVWTWNLYPYGDTTLVVKDSVLGEILGSENSRTWVLDSTIDGSGGFLGAGGAASITLVDSTVTTMVQSVDQGSIDFIRSSLQPHPAGIPSYLNLSGDGCAWLMDTEAPDFLVLNGLHCLPQTMLRITGGIAGVTFASICPADIREKFTDVRLIAEGPAAHAPETLYTVPLQHPGTAQASLPDWCIAPCTCDLVLSFKFGDAAHTVRKTVCDDSPHGRPLGQP